MEQKKRVAIVVTRERVLTAIQSYSKSSGASYDHCVQLLKEAANNKNRPKQQQLAMAALRQILL